MLYRLSIEIDYGRRKHKKLKVLFHDLDRHSYNTSGRLTRKHAHVYDKEEERQLKVLFQRDIVAGSGPCEPIYSNLVGGT